MRNKSLLKTVVLLPTISGFFLLLIIVDTQNDMYTVIAHYIGLFSFANTEDWIRERIFVIAHYIGLFSFAN